MTKVSVIWQENLTAQEAVTLAFGENRTNVIMADLERNNEFLTVSWVNPKLDDHSEIGGVGSLNWHIPDLTVLVIFYEDEATTQAEVDQAMQWMLDNEPWARLS